MNPVTTQASEENEITLHKEKSYSFEETGDLKDGTKNSIASSRKVDETKEQRKENEYTSKIVSEEVGICTPDSIPVEPETNLKQINPLGVEAVGNGNIKFGKAIYADSDHDEIGMKRRHKDILTKCRCELVENLDFGDLKNSLIQKGVLSSRNTNIIESQTTEEAQIEKLLDILPRKGPDAFDKFMEALKEDYYYLYEALEEQDTTGGGKEKCARTMKPKPQEEVDNRESPGEKNQAMIIILKAKCDAFKTTMRKVRLEDPVSRYNGKTFFEEMCISLDKMTINNVHQAHCDSMLV